MLGEALNAVVGLEFSLSKMFGEDRDFQGENKMSFTDSSFEEKLAKARMALDDDEADFLETLKKVQSVASLHNTCTERSLFPKQKRKLTKPTAEICPS